MKRKRTVVRKSRAGLRRPWGSESELSKWGSKGGKTTLKKRGKGYFAKIAKMRKVCRGGRPKKSEQLSNQVT